MDRVLITGAEGMLGRALVRCLENKSVAVLFPCGRSDLDITNSLQTEQVIAGASPNVVIHAAAFTSVDGCESDPERAFLVNAQGTRNVASACLRAGARLLYLSTDYVFDGEKRGPYRETDPPHPVNVYGDSKLRGERSVEETLPDFLIVRTSWLFGEGGHHFVDSIRSQVERGAPFPVVQDEVGSPTYAGDLAEGLLLLMECGTVGIVHVCNGGRCSRYEWARKIVEMSGMNPEMVRPSTSREVHRPAKRPKNSALDSSLLRRATGWSPRSWEDALSMYLRSTVAGEPVRQVGRRS